LVLRLNQETVHDFVPLFLPPYGPHLTPLATEFLKPSLLVFSTPGGLIGNDLSRLFFTYTNPSQGAGCGLTGVGAGEEQAQKVVAGEASRCGEDK
jgi:hypothetical protein